LDGGQVPETVLRKHFNVVEDEENAWRVGPGVRELVQFAELNLLHPWPMKGRFDVIFCRNVVIYFGPAEREALWPRFQDKLNPGGCLCVGHSEKVIPAAAPLLEPDGHTIYRRLA
ncbi:MAG: CheR family methyltransferase, partial [Pseudomonadota bacterium]